MRFSILSLARRRGAGFALFALFVVLAMGCASRPRKHSVSWARQVAQGTPATCPDRAVDVWGDGTPGPDDLRCSYEGTAGGQLVQVRGSVVRETEDMLGTGVEDRVVEVVSLDPGDAGASPLGTTKTDAQGRFTMSVVLRPGAYLVRVAGIEAVEAGHRIEVVAGTGRIDDFSLYLPAP